MCVVWCKEVSMLPNTRFLSFEFQSKNYLSSLDCSYINCNTYVDETC